MPNLTAREMLSRLPVRMAEGGEAAGVSAAYRKAMETGGQQTVDDYYANLRRDAATYLANPNAPTGPEAYNILLQSGISTSDLINAGVGQAVLDKIFTVQQPAGQTTATGQVIPGAATQFNTPAGMTSAYERSPDLMNEMKRLSGGILPAAIGYDRPRDILDRQGRQYVEGLQQDGINAAERAQMLEYATERGYTFDDLRNAGVDPSLLFNTVTPPPKPYVPPKTTGTGTYTAPTVYQPLPSQPDIYAVGQDALDTAFRNSAPRTAIPGMPGQFDYTPAAKLRPATGAGYTWTPPSVTSRPRSLLSPRDIQAYGGTVSKSQQFAQNRALVDRNLRTLLGSTPALTNTSTYNLLRNRVMSGEFGADPARVFNPETAEGQRFQAYLATLSAAAPASASVRAPATTGTVADLAGAGQTTTAGTTVAGGYAAPIEASPLAYGGYREFNRGGAVKKPDGFANGGIATADRRPLDPSDPLYITEAPRVSPDAQVPVEEFIRRQTAPSPRPTAPSPRMARAAQMAAQPKTESASMLSNLLSGAAQIPGTVYEYGKEIAQSERPLSALGEDVSTMAGSMYEGLKQDPIGFGLDMAPIIGEIRSGMDAKKYSDMANEAQAAGDTALADSYRQIATMAAAGAVPFGGIGARGARRAAMSDMSEVPPDSARGMLDALTPEGGGAPDVPEGDVPVGSAASMLDELDQATTPDVRLSRAELGRVNASVGSNRSKQRIMKEEARRIKGNFLPTDGWERIEFSGVKKGKPEFQKIAYGFQKPPAGIEKEAWANRLSDSLVSEVDGVVERARAGDKAALGILRQANWYRSMRDQLRSEFGGVGDVFADVLGTTSAQTNVEQNFANASEILRRYSRGEFDAELQAYENRIKQGLPVDGKTLTALHNAGEFPLITNSAGKLFNTNSPSSMGALLDMFRSVKTGSAPKTPNFTGNLIGLTNEATVDVWAARMLRRLSGQSRIPPVAEQGVTGTHLVGSSLGSPRVGGEFGFGQEVFRNAANRINASGNVKSIVPEMGDLGPDDLQAVAWFMEKERWTDNGWTTKAGEGGSLEYEMSLAGSPEQARIDDLRREINTGFKAPNKRKRETDAQHAERVAQARSAYDNKQELAAAELRSLNAPLQRYTLGVSGERPALPMSNYAQAELAAELDDVVRNDPSVLGYNLANTYGSFMGATERALNAEFVVQQDFNPDPLIRRMVEQGKNYDQDAVFISKAVRAGTPNARPGVEIFFKQAASPDQLAKITASLRERGIDGFTYITDMRFDDRINRQARSGAPETASLTGLRFQYVPEFDEGFDPSRADEIYREKERLFRGVLNDTMADENVSDARVNYYDTQVFFRDGYDEYLTRTAPRGNSRAGGELPSGASPTQPNNGGRAGTELSKPVPDGLNQAPGGSIPQLKKGGAVTSSRRMLETLMGKKSEGQRVDASGLQRFANGGEASPSPTPQELLAQIDRSMANSPAIAYGTASSAPAREVTESRNMLRRLSDAFGQNVTAPVTGAALDMTAGVGDLLQMGAKAGAKRLGIETKPFTPVSSAVQESLGVAGYDPYAPAALAASVLLPAAGPLRAAGAATRPMMSMAAPGSAKETLSRLTPILDREASVAASAELAAMGARELAPDNVTAEIAAAIAGGGAYNTLDNILGSASRGPTTSGMAAKAPTETTPSATTPDIQKLISQVPSYHMEDWTQNAGLPEDVVAKYWKLGDAQRDVPERAMLKAQNALGGGVLSPTIEHIGDLTNRMTPKHSLGFAYEETLGKAKRYLASLKSGYGFRREHDQNMRSNAAYNNVPYEEHKANVDAALLNYANAHRALAVHNPLQRLARDASVALGEQRFEDAGNLLDEFVTRIPTKAAFVEEMKKFETAPKAADDLAALRNTPNTENALSGYDTDFPITHESSNPNFDGVIRDDDPSFVFDGLFGLGGLKGSMLGPGQGANYTYLPRIGKVARPGDVDFEYEKSVEFLKKEFPEASDDQIDLLYRVTAEDAGASSDFESDEFDDLLYGDAGERWWMAQNLRGKMAVDQGYDAVAMSDENGTSYFIPYGSKAKKIGTNFDWDSYNSAVAPKAAKTVDKAKGGLATKSNVERATHDNRKYL